MKTNEYILSEVEGHPGISFNDSKVRASEAQVLLAMNIAQVEILKELTLWYAKMYTPAIVRDLEIDINLFIKEKLNQ